MLRFVIHRRIDRSVRWATEMRNCHVMFGSRAFTAKERELVMEIRKRLKFLDFDCHLLVLWKSSVFKGVRGGGRRLLILGRS